MSNKKEDKNKKTKNEKPGDKKSSGSKSSKSEKASGQAYGNSDKTYQSGSGFELVADRREYFLRMIKSQKVESVVAIVSTILLVLLAYIVVSTEKKEVFFQVDEDNTQVELTPIYEPKYSNAFVADWVNKCLIETFDFYYGDYEEVLNDVSERCWSNKGMQSLQEALESSGNLQAVRERELFMQLVIDSTPRVVRTNTPSGEDNPYRWMVQGEGSIALSSRTDSRGEDVELTVVVSRSSLQEKPVGLSIDQILLRN